MAIKINLPSKGGAKPSAIESIKEKIAKQQKEEQEVKETITGLTDDEAPPLARVQDAIAYLNTLWEQEEVPVASIKLGLNSVLKLIKQYEDIVLELEPEAIEDIVTTALKLTDEETRSIFDKAAKKKTSKKKASKKRAVKDMIKAMKEEVLDEDDDELDLGF